MKRQTAKEILAESFRELAETRNIDKVTVRDITENCGYSTATFYRQFTDKYDLIAWIQAQETAKILQTIDGDKYTWEQALVNGARHYFSERAYLKNLFLHTSGHDSFIRYLTEINVEALKKNILRITGWTEMDDITEMYLRVYCLGTVSITCEWIMGMHDVTPDEMATIYRNSLPEPLEELLAG